MAKKSLLSAANTLKKSHTKLTISFSGKVHLNILSTINKSLSLKGDVANHFYIILKGTVILKLRVFDERIREFTESVLTELGTGAAFGELAILENKSRGATVVCKTNCHFASLHKTDYQNILGSNKRN